MDERKMLEEIRRSAGKIDAPESLRPEHVEDMVRGRQQKKKKLPVYQIGGMAAAILLIFAAAWQAGNIGDQGEPERAAALTEAAQEAVTEAAVEKNVVQEAEDKEEKEVIPHVSSEEELYLALADMMQTRDMGLGLMAEDGASVYEMEKAEEKTEATAEESMGSAEKADDFSQTNLQEADVDEGDIVKTDGTYIYALSGSRLCIVKAVDGRMEKMSEIALPGQEDVEEMYLDGDRLLLLASGSEASMDEEEEDVYSVDRKSFTKVYTYELGDRRKPKLSGSVTQEGYYRTSRKNGDTLYLFTEYQPILKDTRDGSSYLPEVQGKAMGVDDIYLPEYANRSNYLVISSVDVKQPDQVIDRKAIVSAAEQFYVSAENIYTIGYHYENGRDYTQILKFHYQDGKIKAAAAGEIRGYVNDSFSVNEYNGYLRAVATDWNNDEEMTYLYVLDENLEICGKIENLAPGESVRSARFMGNTGYFVTFRDTDPLFSVDLTDPKEPKILGELKITGFSSYLHFYGENKLLGIGNEVDPETGEYQGIKLSMFDVSDPSDVKEIDKYVIRDSHSCPGLYNYKAIMINPAKNLFGLECENNYLVFSCDGEKGFVNEFLYELRKKEEWDANGNVRGLYIGSTLYLSNSGGLKSFDMEQGYEKIEELTY